VDDPTPPPDALHTLFRVVMVFAPFALMAAFYFLLT
jgi:hypothetical protein